MQHKTYKIIFIRVDGYISLTHFPIINTVKVLLKKLCLPHTDIWNTTRMDKWYKVSVSCFFSCSNQIIILLLSKAIHLNNFIFIPVKHKEISILFDKSFLHKTGNCLFRHSINIHAVTLAEMNQFTDMLCSAVRINTDKSHHVIITCMDTCFFSAYRAGFRKMVLTGYFYFLSLTVSWVVFADLRNDHVRFIHSDPVTDPKIIVHDVGNVVKGRPCNRRSFQFYRIKYRNRVKKSCPACRPFNIC